MFLHTVWLPVPVKSAAAAKQRLKSAAFGLPWSHAPVLTRVFGPWRIRKVSDWEKESNHELGKRDHASLYCSRSYKICTKVKVRIEVDYIASSTDEALKRAFTLQCSVWLNRMTVVLRQNPECSINTLNDIR